LEYRVGKGLIRVRGFRIYTTTRCGWCTRAKKLLDDNGITYTEIEVTSENSRELAKLISEARGTELSDLYLTVPQIFFDGVLLGGYEGLKTWIDLHTGESLPDMMPIVPPYPPLKEQK
jgi:glutaredoxin